ncbi:hypothetical protein BC826DRAFT_1035776 [Russula brevipes]|nr:hypothetical protein BC826DRAFT_1035776 [Russula brevipes]
MSNVLVALPRRFKRLLSVLWAMVRRRQVHDPDRVVSHNWLMLDRAAHLTERLVKSDSLSLDREIVKTILKSLNQGHELERFLASIPSFYRSAHVKEPAQDRIKLSLQVMDVDPFLLQRTLFHALTRAAQPIMFQCADFVLVADRSADSEDQTTQLLAKCIIAVAISHLKDHQPDPRLSHVVERWLNSATFANTYRGRRASMKMINLVRLARVLNSAGHANWDDIFDNALLAVAEFEEVESAADEYKMEFCVLWNQLLDAVAASADDGSNASHILPHIHNVHTALHGGTATNNSAFYTRCPFLTHHPTPHHATSRPNLNGSGSRKVGGKKGKREEEEALRRRVTTRLEIEGLDGSPGLKLS